MMSTSVVMMALMAVTLDGDVPEAAWLGSLPGQAAIVVRLSGVDAARAELGAMVDAMGPALAEWVKPGLDEAVARFEGEFGEEAMRSPLLVLFELPPIDAPAWPLPFAVVAQAETAEGVRRALAGGDAATFEELPGGYQEVTGVDGGTTYVVRGDGFVAFGPSEGLIAAVADPGEASLGGKIAGDLSDHLFKGDVGVYADLSAIQRRYPLQIFLLRRLFSGQFDRLAMLAGNPGVAEAAGIIYERIHLDLMDTGSFALGADASAEGLELGGVARVKPGTRLADRLAEARPNTAARVAALPADAAQFYYQECGPSEILELERLILSFLGRDFDPDSPAIRKIAEAYREAGRVEVASASGGPSGFRMVYLPNAEHPLPMFRGMMAVLEAMDGPESRFFSGVAMEPDAERLAGVPLTRSTVRFDFESPDRLKRGESADPERLREFLGGETMTEWLGTDGRVILSAIARDWEEAKGLLEDALAGDRGIGSTVGYREVRAKLPERVSILMLVQVGRLVEQLSGEAAPGPGVAGVPEGPTLIGGAIAPAPEGYRFDLVVPSSVGRALDRDVIPRLRAMVDELVVPGDRP